MICPILTSHFQPSVKNARPVLIHAECQHHNCVLWVAKKPPMDIEGCAIKVIAGALVAIAVTLGEKE